MRMADSDPPEQRPRAAQEHPSPGRRRDQGKPAAKSRGSKGSGPPTGSRGKRPHPGNGSAPAEAPRAESWRRPPHRSYRQSYAAIDLGTNNCRLLIARPSGPNFVVIDAFSRVVRLGEDLAHTGRLSDASMDRAVEALKICSDKLRKRDVHLARSVATEACRRAENGEEFIQRVKDETGIALDIISAEEEARLAVLGCHILLEDGVGPAMIFDIGGGSTELVLIEPGGPVPRIIDWQSVPWGVVSLTDTAGRGQIDDDVKRAARYSKMRGLVRDSFAEFEERVRPYQCSDMRLLGTSGTVTTLASVHLELPQYDRKAVDGLIMPSSAMRDVASGLAAMKRSERELLPCIGHDRAELVVAGCAILETILDLWPASRLGVADRGIREGILRSLMAADHEGDVARAELLAARQRGF